MKEIYKVFRDIIDVLKDNGLEKSRVLRGERRRKRHPMVSFGDYGKV